jgi:multiple sugar transport system permease protein
MKEGVSLFGLVGRVSKTALLLVYALFALFPLLWMIIMSLKPDSQMFTTTFIFSPTMENYGAVFLRSDYSHFFFNNLIVSISAVILSLIVGVPAAYALARFQFKWKEDIEIGRAHV